ncbi:MAG: bifunctional DNA primase/polymerase [Polyangia bacterium]
MDAAIYSEGLRLSSLGLACHWLWRRTKIPVAKGYQQMPYLPPHVLRSMYSRGFNVGLHTGKVKGATYSVVAVDIDGTTGGEYVKEYLPKTPIVSISARGESWLYRYPEGVAHIGNRAKIRTKDGTKIDLDIRGDGGNLAIPPSVHPSGVIYQAAQPWTGELLSAMPVFDTEWIPTGPVQAARPTMVQATDDARRMERARRLCVKWQTSERGSGHGTDTWKLAGYLIHTLGLSEASAYDAIARHYNPRCPTPYGERELWRKVSEAATKRRAGR